MAGCYHDTQDFKSDLNIEVAREGDILEAGQDLKERKCDKNPGHQDFIPFKDLTLEHLPIEDRNRDTLDNIKRLGSRVVRLVVGKIKNGRLIKEAGTGHVLAFNNTYFIETNNHVVKTVDDVKHCTIDFHYDDDSRSNVLTSRGVRLECTCPYRDITLFTFHPVPDFLHQLDWMDKCPSIVIMFKNNQIVTKQSNVLLIRSKKYFLCELDINSSLIDLMFISCHDGSLSYIKSWYFKFKPIPSNIQQLTSIKLLYRLNISIEIRIAEDDGHSRVIPGKVVKFVDEYVVKISESIFQDEVKKCRLVLNGEVIGRGTRLYFQPMKSSYILKGIDLEHYIKRGVEKFYIFEFHHITIYLEALLHPKISNNMGCIGHPHGGIKMATFGKLYGETLKRYDNQYRPIDQPGPDCKCKEIACWNYSCKTCPGSSGSPVFLLYSWNFWGDKYSHFMGEKVERFLPNGERKENINIAWCQG